MEVLLSNAEKTKQAYEAFGRGDLPFIIAQLHPDCIWEVAGAPEIPFAGIYHGPDDVMNFFQKLNEHVEFTEMTPEHHFEVGNTVITTGRWSIIVRKTGKPVSTLFTMYDEYNEEGKIVHFRDCYDTLAAAKAFEG